MGCFHRCSATDFVIMFLFLAVFAGQKDGA